MQQERGISQSKNILVSNQAASNQGINRGQVKASGQDTLRGEVGIPLPTLGGASSQPKSTLSAAGSNVLGNTKSLLKKKSDKSSSENTSVNSSAHVTQTNSKSKVKCCLTLVLL